MADGIKPRVKRVRAERGPTTPDPVEIAMELDAADTAPDSPAREVLRKHSRLIDSQLRYLGLQALSERLSAGLKLLVATVGLVAALALGLMVWNASQDRSLVIQALNAPPDLVARGLTGEVLASKLLDRLAEIDANADSLRAPETFRNDWGDDIQIEIPQTGVSIGELDRYLRQWLGERTGIGGEVVRNADGTVSLTVRAGSGGAVTQSGSEAELNRLLQQAAEAVFHKTQPFRYSKYLEASGRADEAMAVAVELAANGPVEEKPWAWAQISNLRLYLGDYVGAAEAGRRAVELDPDNGLGWLNLATAQGVLSHDAATASALARSVKLMTSGGGQLSDIGVAIGFTNRSYEAYYIGDFRKAVELSADRRAQTDYIGLDTASSAQMAQLWIRGRDLPSADRLRDILPDAEMVRRTPTLSFVTLPTYERSAILEEWPAAEASLRTSIVAAEAMGSSGALINQRALQSRLAWVLMKLGRLEEARPIAAVLPNDCDFCLPIKAAVLDASGDRGGADRLYRLAIQRTPDFPTAYSAWGETLLERGDLRAALARFTEAQTRGPRWADPFKFEGDAHMRSGQADQAVGAYRKAVERAPNWGGAHLGLGRALAALGRDRDAAKSYAAAAGMDLTATERAEVAVRLGSRTQP